MTTLSNSNSIIKSHNSQKEYVFFLVSRLLIPLDEFIGEIKKNDPCQEEWSHTECVITWEYRSRQVLNHKRPKYCGQALWRVGHTHNPDITCISGLFTNASVLLTHSGSTLTFILFFLSVYHTLFRFLESSHLGVTQRTTHHRCRSLDADHRITIRLCWHLGSFYTELGSIFKAPCGSNFLFWHYYLFVPKQSSNGA